MSAQHTPGPWSFEDMPEDADGDCLLFIEPDVCAVEWSPVYASTAEANARLIAAAPELLAACQRLLNPTDEGPRLEDIVRAAIAKATTP